MKADLIKQIKEDYETHNINGVDGVLIFEGENNVVFKAFDEMTVEELIEVEPLGTVVPTTEGDLILGGIVLIALVGVLACLLSWFNKTK